MAGFIFNGGAYELLRKLGVDWETDTIKARLVPTADGAIDVDADVMTGIGSTQASATTTLGSCVGPTKDDGADIVKYSSATAVFASASPDIGACDRMVIFKFNTNDADSIPIAKVDITEIAPSGSDVTVPCPASGWFYTDQQP
jgi:hypothetical protein